MDRRNFIHLGLASTSLLLPSVGLAKSSQKTMAGGVYFTEQNPGRWSKKVGGHLPSIEIDKGKGNAIVQVVTAHAMNGYTHYIVKHVLLDENYQFLQEKVFNPMEDKAALSVFTLENYTGTIHALSMCNLHDVWMSSAKI